MEAEKKLNVKTGSPLQEEERKFRSTQQLLDDPRMQDLFLFLAEEVHKRREEESYYGNSPFKTTSNYTPSKGTERVKIDEIGSNILEPDLINIGQRETSYLNTSKVKKTVRVSAPALPTFKGEKEEDVEQFIARFKVIAKEME